MCVLPQILLLGDTIIRKTSFSINKGASVTHKIGLIRVNGRVRGHLDGLIDAEIHGVFRGTLNAVIDVGSEEEISEQLLPEPEPEQDGGEKQ